MKVELEHNAEDVFECLECLQCFEGIVAKKASLQRRKNWQSLLGTFI
jgi:hypothetical protein